MRFTPGEERVAADESELIEGLDNPRLDELFPDEVARAAPRRRADPQRERSRSTSTSSWPGGRRRCSSARASTTSACRRSCRRWSTGRRRRSRATAASRVVQPAEAPFSGFVFKIQANMDPQHRDRIAFFRVCSGRYRPA